MNIKFEHQQFKLKTVALSDGNTTTFRNLERPQVLIENGKPTHVFFACINEVGEIYNIARPLK